MLSTKRAVVRTIFSRAAAPLVADSMISLPPAAVIPASAATAASTAWVSASAFPDSIALFTWFPTERPAVLAAAW